MSAQRQKLEENKMFKKLKDKKGFTLVELIVVLVILAILAALLVPTLTGYIDRPRKSLSKQRPVMLLGQRRRGLMRSMARSIWERRSLQV